MKDTTKMVILNLLAFAIVTILIWCTEIDGYSYIVGMGYVGSLTLISLHFQRKRMIKREVENLERLLEILDSRRFK